MEALINQAREDYAKHGQDFDEKLAWHHEHGFVIDIPYLFAIGYFLDIDGDKVCHVTYMTGDMRLLILIGENFMLDKIQFERNLSGRTKRYDFLKLAKRIK